MIQKRLCLSGSVLLIAALLWTSPVQARGQQAAPEPEPGLGTIVGRVVIGQDMEGFEHVRAILLSPMWTEFWNSAVQRGLDDYFSRYRDAVARNRETYNELTGWAHRDAAGTVLSEMQRSLGERFRESVRMVSPEGRFEFTGVPYGDYRVIVIASVEGRALIWTENVRVLSPIPQFIEVQNIVQ